MFTQAYSFEAGSDITIMTEAQLEDLIEERRKRGMSPELLEQFRIWHLARLQNR